MEMKDMNMTCNTVMTCIRYVLHHAEELIEKLTPHDREFI